MNPAAAPEAPKLPSRSRRRRIVVLGGLLVVLIVILFVPQAWSLRVPERPESTWLLFLLSTLDFLAIVILTIVLVRQIAKLYAERRAHVLGAQFKTKLVIGALALSLTPVICMFGFTYGLINRTLDKWFSQPVVNVRDDNQSTMHLLTDFVTQNAQAEANLLQASPDLRAAVAQNNWPMASQVLARHEVTLGGGFAAVLGPDGIPAASFHLPPGYRPGQAGDDLNWDGREYVLAESRLPGGRRAEVGMPIPAALTAQITQLHRDRDRYDRLARERRSLRLIYTGYLLLLTLAILFGATWMALYLSRMVTVPLGELAAATHEISSGNLAYRVREWAQDEIGTLMNSFNRMAAELETSRGQIEASQQQLQTANRELEARRRYIEAILENTPSAVLSLDRDYHIERVNPALARLFGPAKAQPRELTDLFDAASLGQIHHLLRKSERWPQATGQIEVARADRPLTLASTAAALPEAAAVSPLEAPVGSPPGAARPHRFSGYVLVLEDVSDLLRVEKTAAWREVAQRIAHEIKNPLTPIALSAQRIQRRLGRAAAGAGGSAAEPGPQTRTARTMEADSAVIAECAATIETEVHSLQRLVDEFSAFARFPRAQPVDCDLNEIIERALRTFEGRLGAIQVLTRFDPLPPLRLDPEDMKRVFLNLIDNAAEAMLQSPYRQITLATQHLDGIVEALVADTGHGLPAADKERLFLPYYSTKGRGSGLGLAIVQRIVEENGGTLRAEDNHPVGARFLIELPVEG